MFRLASIAVSTRAAGPAESASPATGSTVASVSDRSVILRKPERELVDRQAARCGAPGSQASEAIVPRAEHHGDFAATRSSSAGPRNGTASRSTGFGEATRRDHEHVVRDGHPLRGASDVRGRDDGSEVAGRELRRPAPLANSANSNICSAERLRTARRRLAAGRRTSAPARGARGRPGRRRARAARTPLRAPRLRRPANST